MLGKVKNFICNWFSFGNQTQGIKRERDLSSDDIPQLAELSVPTLNHAPNNKKLKLMSGIPHDRENKNQGMAHTSHTKRDLESKEQNWSQILKASALQTSTPLGSPTPVDAQLLKDANFGGSSKVSKEDPKLAARKLKLHQPLTATESDLQSVEVGSSLSQIEKLVTERLGNSAAVGAKPKTNNFHKSDSAPTFNFTPMENNIAGQAKKKDHTLSSPHSVNMSYKQTNFSQSWRKPTLNGGIQKPFRPMLQKLYGSPKRQKSKALNNFSLLNNRSQPLAIQSCVRMEEKLYYKALLSQFVSKSPFARVSTSTSSPTSSRSSGIVVEKIETKEAHSVQKELRKSVIDLDNESSSFEKTCATPVLRTPATPVVRINTLEEALAQSPQYDGRFISDIKSRYNAKERERERLRSEEAIRSKVLAENREGWENELEQRLRKQLEIITRPVLDERAEEVVVLPEITDEMHAVIEKALNGYADGEVLCDAFNLTITRRDVKTLAGLNWLNDQVINFYLTLVMERSSSGDWPKTFAFNTFFYPKLMSSGHSGLKRWTRKVDLFQQDVILIPVHLGLHWCLATVCPKEQAIRYYDSMGGRNLECLNGLKRYMEAESLDKKKTVLDTSNWKLECVENIPQQMNGSDCGMFACKYAEYISRKAKITFEQKDMPYFRRRMVYEIITQKLTHP